MGNEVMAGYAETHRDTGEFTKTAAMGFGKVSHRRQKAYGARSNISCDLKILLAGYLVDGSSCSIGKMMKKRNMPDKVGFKII